MTNDQMQSMRDDIAFMKELAEDGQKSSTRVGGGILASAGLIFGAAALAEWGIATGRLPVSANNSLYLWLGAVALFLIAMGVMKATLGKAANRGPVNRANQSVWIGAGWSIGALSVAFFIAAYTSGQWIFMNLLAPVVLAIYGTAWFVNSVMSKRQAFALIAVGCFLGVIGMGFVVTSPALMLAYAAALFLFAFLPGVILMRGRDAS
jgi:hypothetical protein